MNLVNLDSVGAFFDTHQGIIYPMLSDGTMDSQGVDVMVHDPEWFDNLSIEDFEVVEEWFNNEDLDIQGMLLSMDDYCDEHPDFDMAMNGIDIY
tara:strand:+ start:126 stop:407 length:282 start_codon:yes stop_codon:yes gene_type:complete